MKFMDEKRKGEIALALLHVQLRQRGIDKFDKNVMRRQLGQLARDTGIDVYELYSFLKEETQRLFEETWNFPLAEFNRMLRKKSDKVGP